MARRRPTASDVQQVLSDFDAGSPQGLIFTGVRPGADSALSPVQMRALRRSDRLTTAECMAHRQLVAPLPPAPKPAPPLR